MGGKINKDLYCNNLHTIRTVYKTVLLLNSSYIRDRQVLLCSSKVREHSTRG